MFYSFHHVLQRSPVKLTGAVQQSASKENGDRKNIKHLTLFEREYLLLLKESPQRFCTYLHPPVAFYEKCHTRQSCRSNQWHPSAFEPHTVPSLSPGSQTRLLLLQGADGTVPGSMVSCMGSKGTDSPCSSCARISSVQYGNGKSTEVAMQVRNGQKQNLFLNLNGDCGKECSNKPKTTIQIHTAFESWHTHGKLAPQGLRFRSYSFIRLKTKLCCRALAAHQAQMRQETVLIQTPARLENHSQPLIFPQTSVQNLLKEGLVLLNSMIIFKIRQSNSVLAQVTTTQLSC